MLFKYCGIIGLLVNIPIGLYRENAIAIGSEARDPFGGNVYYVTMEITFPIPEFVRVGNVICIVT